jgi:hypothetical protein
MTRRHASAAAALATIGALATLAPACASVPDDGSSPRLAVGTLDEAAYASRVHPVFESRCGSPACHGALPRGLRVYGAHSLRTGGEGATTAEEAHATYASIVGLEPERMRDFLAKPGRTAEDARALTLLSKPLARERHRGGTSLIGGEPAERCMSSWLIGRVDPAACADAIPSESTPNP